MKNIYWRWKKEKLWYPARIKMLGNGFAKLYPHLFTNEEYLTVLLDEIETKEVTP
jgi:hypothetical protein